MSDRTLELLFKWGPWAILVVMFLIFFLSGIIKGRYKVLRRFIYVALFVVLSWAFIMPITKGILDLNITIKGVQGVRNFIIQFIENNETINKFLSYSQDLKNIVIEAPEIIVAPILFLALVVVVLPLSFPLYWIYLIIYNLIAKYVFNRKKYETNENGDIRRNEKGKKIKVKRKKHRLVGGLIQGVQGVVLVCIIMMPVNFVNRLYNKAKKTAELDEGETLCGSVDQLKENEEICKYLDLYGETIFAKMSGENSLDKKLTDHMTTTEIDGEKISLGDEASNIVVSLVLLNDSGLIKLLTSGNLSLETLDLTTINFDKISLAIDYLFDSSTLSSLSEAGVKYVLNEVLNDKLVDVLKDENIVAKLEYASSDEIKQELKSIVDILKFAVDNQLDKAIIDNKSNVIDIVNSDSVSEENIEALLNKILSLNIIRKAMPSALSAYVEKYGVNVPQTMTNQLNGEISDTLASAIKFVKTMEISKIQDITEENIVDNLANALFEEGAIKTDSKESLAELLHKLNSSYLFKDVLSEQLNKIFEKKEYKVDARILKYVDSEEAWLKELDVLETGFNLYKEYKDSDVVDYSKVGELLNKLSTTKAMISVLPFAYDQLLPKIGIEIDKEGLPIIDFDGNQENVTKLDFYNIWEGELVLLKNIADAVGKLELQSVEDITVDLLGDSSKVDSLSTVMGEVYKSQLLKDSFVNFIKGKINEFVADYEVEFTKEELLAIDNKEKWNNEFTNINKILNVDFSDENNITSATLESVFDAVDSMALFNKKKVEILKYAVEKSKFLSDDEYSEIDWPDSSNQEEIDAFYDNETSVLINIIDEKEKFESLTDQDLKGIDVTDIGELLNEVTKSNILKPIVVNKIAELLIEEGINDDRDELPIQASDSKVRDSIENVEDWKKELNIIKELVNVNSDNFDDYVGEYTMIEVIFGSIDQSTLLTNSKATLLKKAVDSAFVNDEDVDSSVITVEELMSNSYLQYYNEVNVFIKFAKNKTAIEGLSDITSLTSENKDAMADVLNSLKNSKILESKYVKTIDKALSNVKSNTTLKDTYKVTFKDSESTNNYTSIDWSTEIDALLTISNNINTVSTYNISNISDDTEEKVKVIGNTLDAVSSSTLLGENQAKTIADAVIKEITGMSTITISDKRVEGESWETTFKKALGLES